MQFGSWPYPILPSTPLTKSSTLNSTGANDHTSRGLGTREGSLSAQHRIAVDFVRRFRPDHAQKQGRYPSRGENDQPEPGCHGTDYLKAFGEKQLQDVPVREVAGRGPSLGAKKGRFLALRTREFDRAVLASETRRKEFL